MARKIKAQIAAVGTDSGEVIVGDYLAGDTLEGLGGDDTLIGLAGADTLIGGDGADTFVISPQWLKTNDGWWFSPDQDGARDFIADFTKGEDKIDLQNLIKHVDTDGDQKSEQYPVTPDDVTIEALGGNLFRAHVHQVAGNMTFDAAVDLVSVTGEAPDPMTDFIYS